MMTSPRRYLAAAVLLLLTSTRTEAQPPAGTAAGGRLEPTTTSEPARTAFRTAWFNQQNVDPAGARAELAKAIAADPRFGLAQAFQAFLGTGTAAERERAINTALTNMGGASVPELLLALYWRETAAGRAPIAAQLLGILVPLVPGDAELAYVQFSAQNTGTPAVRSQNFRSFLQRFPQHAAAHNSAAYTYWLTGDQAAALAAAEEYLRLAPQHYNSHDTYADILMLLQRPQDAQPHAQRALEIAALPAPQMKLGAIRLMLNDAAGARTYFETGRDAATGFGARLPFLRWIAVSHVYAKQGKTAVQALEQIATEAQAANDPGNVASAHDWAAVIEAYTGNRRAVAAHVNAAATAVPQPGAGHYVNKAIAFARAGETEQARGALAQLTTMAPNNANIPLVTAILALDARDLPAAEAALAQPGPTILLANALRAELMIRKGQRREGLALRDVVLASPVKLDGNPGVDFPKVVARLRAQQIR